MLKLKEGVEVKTLRQIERDYILEVLKKCRGDVIGAARVLKVSKATIFNRTTRFERWEAQGKKVPQVPRELSDLWVECESESDKIWVALDFYRGDRKKAAYVLQMSPSTLTRKQDRPKPQIAKQLAETPVLVGGAGNF